jgi:hypothetical protein
MIIRSLLAAVALLLMSGPTWAVPTTDILWTPHDNAVQCLSFDDSVLLLVRDGNEEIARYPYCSSYGRSAAKVYVDKRDSRLMYVLIEYYVGRGTSATTDMLRIMRVDNDTATLHELGHVLLRVYDAPASKWETDYDAEAAPGGGLVVTLHYAPGPAPECCAPPEKQITIRVGP